MRTEGGECRLPRGAVGAAPEGSFGGHKREVCEGRAVGIVGIELWVLNSVGS